ncbi:MAG: hypothetical protein PVF22_02185 [Candidatus Aminicenantes bacterium]
MFARITEFQLKIEKIDKGIELYKRSVIPASKKQEGYRQTYALIDRNSGKGAAITFWDSEQEAVASEKNLYYQQQLVKFLSFLEKPAYTRELYEVVIEA